MSFFLMRSKKSAKPRSVSIEFLEARIAPANLAYAIGVGGTGNQSIQEIGVDAAGNTYVTGKFQGNVDFDPGPGVNSRLALAGDTDSFVAKYTSTWALAWVDVIHASNEPLDNIQLAVADNGDAFIAGEFGTAPNTTLSFSDHLGPPSQTLNHQGSGTDLFVAKIGTSGGFQWVTQYSSDSVGLRADDIATDSNGGIYFVGSFFSLGGPGSVSFDSFSLNVDANENDLFVVKLQDGATPAVVYANDTNSTVTAGFDRSTIAVDTTGQAVIAGSFSGSINLASIDSPFTLTATSPLDNFVARLNPVGTWVMAEALFPRAAQDSNPVVALAPSGDIYIGGSFSSPTIFSPGTSTTTFTPAGLGDAYLLHLDNSGSTVSVAQFGGKGDDSGGVVVVGKNGDVYFGGGFAGAFDMDPSEGVNMSASGGVYFLKFDSSGNFVDAIQFDGSNGTDAGFNTSGHNGGGGCATLDTAGGLHIAGAFRGVFDVKASTGKTTLTSKGGNDFFVASYFPGDLVAQDLQTPVMLDAFTLSSAGKQSGEKILTDASGNIYVAGLFTGTLAFDPALNLPSLTSIDPDGNIFVVKFDKDGTALWADAVQMSVTIDNFAGDIGVEIALDGSGGVYLAGEYEASATFIPNGGSPIVLHNADSVAGSQHRDIFLSHITSAGAWEWAGSIGAAGGNEFLNWIAVNPVTHSVDIAGTFGLSVNFDFGVTANTVTAINGTGNGDGFIAQYSSTGVYEWVRQLGGTNSAAFVESMAYDGNGDLAATGEYSGTPDFNIGGSPVLLTAGAGKNDIFVAKFSGSTGQVIWHREIGGLGDDQGRKITTDSQHNLVVVGFFSGSIDFDPGTGTHLLIESGADEGDAFVLKLDNNGGFLNAIAIGGAGHNESGLVLIGANDSIYIAGDSNGVIDLDPGPGIASLPAGRYFAHYQSDLSFFNGFLIDSTVRADAHYLTLDANDNVLVTGSLMGTTNFGGSTVFTSKTPDLFVARYDTHGVFDAAHPRTFHDANGDLVTMKLTGSGTARFDLVNSVGDLSDLARLDLSGTNRTTTLTISVTKFGNGTGQSVVQKILTTDGNQSVGSITLGSEVALGDGVSDPDVDLLVTGALNSLKLGDVAANTLIKLGTDLPYNVATDTTTPDTYNNHPPLTIRNVLGAGVDIRVLAADADASGKGSAQGIGGGGFGNVTIGSWAFAGFLRTTQSIGDLTVQNADFLATLEIDKFGVGSLTQANVGNMNVANGAWGSSGSEIEGDVKAFNAEAFLAGATITAATIGAVKLSSGAFDGTITLTDSQLNSIGLFTVNTDFTGSVVASGPLKKLKIKGDFMGSLTAPSIGSITAFSFIGTTTGDTNGDATKRNITTTSGNLGTITATAGIVQDYEIDSALAFKGFNIALKKLTTTTVGIQGVKIHAATIGNITVNLAASAKAAGVDLTGISDSDFTATGSVGNITVNLAGQSADGIGLENVNFSGTSIGKTHVTVAHGKSPGATARDVDTVEFLATNSIGALIFDGAATGTQVTSLKVSAGGIVGGLTVTAKIAANGSIADSAILAGQSLNLAAATDSAMKAALAHSTLGKVTVSGAVTNTNLVAGGSIGAVSIGGALTDSLLLAGTLLGGDYALNGNETYQRAASIAGVIVKGNLARTSIVAGVNPVNGIFGDSDDTAASPAGTLTTTSALGALKFGPGSVISIATTTHQFAIEAAAIKSLTNSGVTATTFPALLDAATAGEDTDDILVRLIP